MLYTLQTENVNINYLARLHFLDLYLLGETGRGKTRTAKHSHDLSPRSRSPFIAVNCTGTSGLIDRKQTLRLRERGGQAQLAQSKTSLKQPIAARFSSMKGKLKPGDRTEVYLERIEQDLLRARWQSIRTIKPGQPSSLE